MTFITLEEAKMYLRVDSADEDAVIGSLLSAAGNLCRDVARLSSAQWEDIDSDKPWADTYAKAEMTGWCDEYRRTPGTDHHSEKRNCGRQDRQPHLRVG